MNKVKVVGIVLGLVVAILVPQPATIASAQETPSEPISWLSTGDSFSSGEGVLGNEGACAQSQDAWGPRAARALRDDEGWDVEEIAFSACTGHMAEDFYNRRHPDRGDLWEWALEQASPQDDRFDVITMSFGGRGHRLRRCPLGLRPPAGQVLGCQRRDRLAHPRAIGGGRLRCHRRPAQTAS